MIIVLGKIRILSNGGRKVTVNYRVCTSLYRFHQMYCTYTNHVEDITAVVIG